MQLVEYFLNIPDLVCDVGVKIGDSSSRIRTHAELSKKHFYFVSLQCLVVARNETASRCSSRNLNATGYVIISFHLPRPNLSMAIISLRSSSNFSGCSRWRAMRLPVDFQTYSKRLVLGAKVPFINILTGLRVEAVLFEHVFDFFFQGVPKVVRGLVYDKTYFIIELFLAST